MTIKELKDFIFENHYRQSGFTKENSWEKNKDLLTFPTKLIEKHLILVKPKNTINLIWRKKIG